MSDEPDMDMLLHSGVARPEQTASSPGAAAFIKQLACQAQCLGCLKWLGEFQILACIPLQSSVPFGYVADLANVPEAQLTRIIRMVATIGFLREPQPGFVAHTALSAAFVEDLTLFDSALFLARTILPSALQMSAVTHRNGSATPSPDSAYSVAFNTLQPFYAVCAEHSKVHREWLAYQKHATATEQSAADVILQDNWRELGSAKVVDACAQSTEFALALAKLAPALQIVVQTPPTPSPRPTSNGHSDDLLQGRITVKTRVQGTKQPVEDAMVYLLRFDVPPTASPSEISAELLAHVDLLRKNLAACMLLAVPLLPTKGSVDVQTEMAARVQDLSCLQLTNRPGWGELEKLIEVIESVHDDHGGLKMIRQLRFRNGMIAAVGIKYVANANGPEANPESVE